MNSNTDSPPPPCRCGATFVRATRTMIEREAADLVELAAEHYPDADAEIPGLYWCRACRTLAGRPMGRTMPGTFVRTCDVVIVRIPS